MTQRAAAAVASAAASQLNAIGLSQGGASSGQRSLADGNHFSKNLLADFEKLMRFGKGASSQLARFTVTCRCLSS